MDVQSQIALPSVREIADFFFEGSLRGYASGAEANPYFVVGLSGAKCYTYSHRWFFYVDCYWVGESGFSWGFTMIWYRGVPVWQMSYQGKCSNEAALPFLKKCLYEAYESRKFLGGRGVDLGDIPAGGNFSYFNHWDGGFTNFRGNESISEYGPGNDARSKQVFWHSFQGMLLIPDIMNPEI
jgi:hypothetical protein